jgi:hypothetical protein
VTGGAGRVHLVLRDGGNLRMPPEKDQVSTDQLAVAPNRRIAVNSGTVHGMTGVHLTLWDSRTGRLLQT